MSYMNKENLLQQKPIEILPKHFKNPPTVAPTTDYYSAIKYTVACMQRAHVGG